MSQSRISLTAYLAFDGNCREALDFYASALKGTVGELHTFGGSPMESDIPQEWHDKIMHGTLQFAGNTLMASDRPPGHGEPGFRGISLTVGVPDVAEAERTFAALSSGATITMPLQKTFWATRFGMLTDKFGVDWMVNCDL